MEVDVSLTEQNLVPIINVFLPIAKHKAITLFNQWVDEDTSPVFTHQGKYRSWGWTEWTRGFMYGIPLLLYELTNDESLLDKVRDEIHKLDSYLTHHGVHDHGFNILSSYGHLWRMGLCEIFTPKEYELEQYKLAIRVSSAVQASRWTKIDDGTGFIHSFNGAHSLFVDTIRTCRILVLGWLLGHVLKTEGDENVSLLERAIQHIQNTLKYNIYYGKSRDIYDVPGRVAHESIFNVKTGRFRCASTQQGYSPFSTWTRGLAWAMLGCAEQMEFFSNIPQYYWEKYDSNHTFLKSLEEACRVTADYYIEHTTIDGVPFWDTGAPGLVYLGKYQQNPADPYNDIEPLDSSSAVISAQALLRLGNYLGKESAGSKYYQAGLTVTKTLLSGLFLSNDANHEGLLLHAVYHRPNGWDYIPPGKNIPCGEACMWGDYHLLELLLWIWQVAHGRQPWNFFANLKPEGLLN
ncbi:MAG TPA: glycoside hydrolase family 88 protein [Candidatus Hydrogenedens sp.]|nr:glycoside hydrolase family 88 protein [Candidatus Hydrogenedens sp.]